MRQARLDSVFCYRLLSKNKWFQLFQTCGPGNHPGRVSFSCSGKWKVQVQPRRVNGMTNKVTEQLHFLLSQAGLNQLLVAINTSSLFLLHNRQAWQNFGTLDCLSCLPVIGADVLACADLILGKGKPTAEIDGAVPSQTDNT